MVEPQIFFDGEAMTKPDENGWMPIETAPKDGTVILLWGEFEDGSEPFIGWYSEEDSQCPAADMPCGPFVWKQHEASSIARDCVRFWYPMPFPPVTP